MKPRTANRLTAAAIIAAVFAGGAILRWRWADKYAIGDYEITDLGLIKGYGNVAAINNQGHVVGWTYPADQFVAFIWSPEKGRRPIPPLEGKGSRAYDINDKGQVVGYFRESDEKAPARAFIWDEETGVTELGTLGDSAYSYACAVNNKGQVAGTLKTSDGQWRAFIWDRENGMRELGTLGGKSYAGDINEKGQVVGTSQAPNGQEHAFFWDQEAGMVDIVTASGSASRATSINNSGQVAGERAKKGSARGFIWEPNTGVTDLDIKGQLRGGMKINDSGQAVGYFFADKFLFFKERHSVWLCDPDGGKVELNLGLENMRFVGALDINNRGQILVSVRVGPEENRVIVLTPKGGSRGGDK